MSVALSKESLKLARDIQSLTAENVMLCYQCKKCTLGCPSAYTMRMKPHELMRAFQITPTLSSQRSIEFTFSLIHFTSDKN